MTTLLIATKNIKKNLSFYALYLFSVMLILTIFFAFESFSVNQIILDKISEDGRVETMTSTISIFLMAFVLFFMSYSNNFFMRRRMNELGIYTLLGYRKSSMLRLFLIENVIICMGAYLLGVVLGAILHKGIVSFVVLLLGLNIDHAQIPLFDLMAIKKSVWFVIIVIIVLTFSNWDFLRKKTILNLVRLEKNQEKNLKVRILPAISGFALIIIGDCFLLNALEKKDSLWFTIGVTPVGLVTILSITSGTILAVYSFLPFICRFLENKTKLLYKSFPIVSIPKFIYRIRSNAKTLIMLSLMTAGTLGVFGVGVLSAYYPIVSLKRIIPSAIELRYENPEDISRIKNVLEMQNITGYSLQTTKLLRVQAYSQEGLPDEYSISQEKGRVPGFEILRYSEYKQLLDNQESTIELNEPNNEQCILIKYRPDKENKDIGKLYYVGGNQGLPLRVIGTTLDNAIGFSNSVGTLIVSDEIYIKLVDDSQETINIVSLNGNGLRKNKKLANTLQELFYDNIYFTSAYLRSYEILYENSSTFLLLGFLTVLFFIASGSILHFHNTSAFIYDKDEYIILSKMGYNKKRIKQIIRYQIRLIYLIPFTLGLIHALCGLACYSSLLMDDVLGKGSQMVLPAGISIIISAGIYFLYYLITRSSCYRIILNK